MKGVLVFLLLVIVFLSACVESSEKVAHTRQIEENPTLDCSELLTKEDINSLCQANVEERIIANPGRTSLPSACKVSYKPVGEAQVNSNFVYFGIMKTDRGFEEWFNDYEGAKQDFKNYNVINGENNFVGVSAAMGGGDMITFYKNGYYGEIGLQQFQHKCQLDKLGQLIYDRMS